MTTTSAGHPAWMRRCYLRLLHAADVVVTVSRHLRDIAQANGASPVLIPNGCDPSVLQRVAGEPESLSGIPRPRAVLTGRYNSRVDGKSFDAMVGAFPGISFVVVGDVNVALPTAPNVYALGSVID